MIKLKVKKTLNNFNSTPFVLMTEPILFVSKKDKNKIVISTGKFTILEFECFDLSINKIRDYKRSDYDVLEKTISLENT